jgi:hypothetical protein
MRASETKCRDILRLKAAGCGTGMAIYLYPRSRSSMLFVRNPNHAGA